MAELTETDRRILAALTEDARMPVKVLADRLDLSRTTVAARLDRLVAEHYAFCPDNVDQGSDESSAYGEEIAGSPSWMFWWD